MKYGKKDYAVAALGACLLAMGVMFLKTVSDPQGIVRTLPYLCVGIGSGLFGQGMGNLLHRRALNGNPELLKQEEIERRDERNVAIANRAKAKAYDMMIFVFGAILLAFALIGVDLAAIILLLFAYLLIIGFGLYWRVRYDREM